jgi:pyruvate formate lyase activating enzyme
MIKGLQKLTLIDYPGKIACTVFLFGCNFRCGFCHNPELVVKPNPETYSEEEVLDFLEKRKEQLNGICFTGGEPLLTLKKDFVKKIKKLGYFVKIDTNGSNPKKLKEFLENKLVDYIAMDLKASPEKYSSVINTKAPIKKLEESIKLIIKSKIDYEFRTTILKRFHDKEELEKIGKWIIKLTKGKKPKKYFLQGFVNKGKLIDEDFRSEPNVYENYLKELKPVAEEFFGKVGIRS